MSEQNMNKQEGPEFQAGNPAHPDVQSDAVTVPDGAPEARESSAPPQSVAEENPESDSAVDTGISCGSQSTPSEPTDETAADTGHATAASTADAPSASRDGVAEAVAEMKAMSEAMSDGIRRLVDTTAKIEDRLAELESRTKQLATDFAGRLRFDAVKDEVISKQLSELDGFRRGAVAKEISSVIDNLIFEIDGTRRIARNLDMQEPSEANFRKAVKALEESAEALEDSVLSRVSVKPFTTREGAEFDTMRHVLVKNACEDTSDQSKDGLIFKSVRCGYERTVAGSDGRTRTVVVRPEQVTIWRFAVKPEAQPAQGEAPAEDAKSTSQAQDPQVGDSIA